MQKRCCGCKSKHATEKQENTKRMIIRDSDTENKPHYEAVKHAGEVESRNALKYALLSKETSATPQGL